MTCQRRRRGSYQTIGFTLLLIKGCLVQNADAGIRDGLTCQRRSRLTYQMGLISLSTGGCVVQNADAVDSL